MTKINFKTILHLDQAPQKLGSDLDSNRSTLMLERFYQANIGEGNHKINKPSYRCSLLEKTGTYRPF